MGEIHTFLGAPVFLHDILKLFQTSEDIYPICSQQKCLHFRGLCVQILLLFLAIFPIFPPSAIIPQTLHRAQGHWRADPRSAAARAETLQAIGAGTGGTSFCAGTEGRAEWEDGDEIMGKMEGVIKQRTKMGISCRLYPILPNVKFPPWTPWF